MRSLGFQGSGSSWTQPCDTHWVMIGWQKDRYSTAQSVSFTANLRVVSKAEWDAANTPRGRVGDKPAPNTEYFTYYGVGWERRLGGLIPGTSGDRWWFVRPNDELDPIADEVMLAVTTYGLPAMAVVLEEERSGRPTCGHNVGIHHEFRPCGRPAEVALTTKDRRFFRCDEHAAVLEAEGHVIRAGRWPYLLATA